MRPHEKQLRAAFDELAVSTGPTYTVI